MRGRVAAASSRAIGPSQWCLAGVEPSASAVAAGRASDPRLDLRTGTADDLPFADQSFDTIVLGFCLYLCDPALLPRIVCETDRTFRDGGTLAIVDFDPPSPRRRGTATRPGLWSHKMDYAAPFLAFPAYSLAEVSSASHSGRVVVRRRIGASLAQGVEEDPRRRVRARAAGLIMSFRYPSRRSADQLAKYLLEQGSPDNC